MSDEAVEETVDTLVHIKDYIRLRTLLAQKEEEYETAIAPLKQEFDLTAAILLGICNTQNADSIKTPAGTISRRVQSRYWTSDWGAMYEFINEHHAPHLLEQRIHNSNMKEFLEENPDVLPAGLNNDRKYVIQVRKPTNK